jgi:flavin-dependent dehydrogenase
MATDSRDVDVAVIGGGPVGVVFATLLKRARPGTSVVVLERRPEPHFKIGESLLSTPTRHLRQLGLSDAALRRLFRSKFGQSFWWTGMNSPGIGYHLDSRDMGETYHVERRPLEMLLTRMAERAGVEVRTGIRVSVGELGATGNVLLCRTEDGGQFAVRANMVCDASGPAAIVPRALGHYRNDAPGFNCTAYYGYFRRAPGPEPEIPYWTLNTSNHICFPQGWMWVIALASWERTSDQDLSSMVDYLLDHLDAPDIDLPPRADLGVHFGGTPPDDIVSIGVTVRDDEDTARHLPPGQRFQHYIDRYPGLAEFMSGYELVEHPYATIQRFTQYRGIAHHTVQATGDGWLAMGDAAVFVNPLFAPGLKDGFKLAHAAVPLMAAALDSGDFSGEQFADYERQAADLASLAFDENEMLYRGFRHGQTYQQTTALRLTMGALIVLRLGKLPIPPATWEQIWGRYRAVLAQVVLTERVADSEAWSQQRWTTALDADINPFLAWLRTQDVVRQAQLGRIFTHYTDDLTYRETGERQGYTPNDLCAGCGVLVPATLQRCPGCGLQVRVAALTTAGPLADEGAPL